MKIVAISDTHMGHCDIKLPAGDVLVHAGDATFTGGIKELAAVNGWFNIQKTRFKHIIFVPGNHDLLFQYNETVARALMPGITILIDQEIVLDGIKFYGSPWQPEFENWAYNLPRGPKLNAKWDLIPTDTDVLITHGPPYGYFDRNLGDVGLARKVMEIAPQLHVFGHVHRLGAELLFRHAHMVQTTYANVSMSDEEYRILDDPFVFEINSPKRSPASAGSK